MAQTTNTGTSPASPDQEGLRQQLEEARDEAELNLLQLQQVQEELEFYFLAHQEQQSLLQRYQHEQVRAEALIAGLIEQLESRG
jgi:1,6-anhydro-N-acetylmuramate kinase